MPRTPLHHTSLFQVRQPAFWVYLVFVALGAVFIVGQQGVLRSISPAGWVLSWALLALYALPVVVVVYVLDLYEREPLSLVLGAFMWGAFAATTLAALANVGWGLVVARVGGPEFAARWTAALTAPVVEEVLKGIGVVLIYLIARHEVDDVLDGFVYGAICGLGFAVVEDVFYFMGVFGGQPGGVLAGFYLRVVASGLYSHVLYTGLVGMGVGYAVSRRSDASRARRAGVALGLFALAVLGHFLWNSPMLDLFPQGEFRPIHLVQIPLAAAAKGLPLLLFVAIAVVLARGRERRWIEGALRAEVGGDGISAGELEVLLSPRARRRQRHEMRRRAGPSASRLLHRLQREQVNLAMVRSRVADPGDPALVEQREVCRSLRDALHAIPGAAPGSPPPTGAPPSPPAPTPG
jgi:RsiW-degrading membrane proteinase PrsW (M82 family)